VNSLSASWAGIFHLFVNTVEAPVTLEHREQESLLHVIDTGTRLASVREFALWSQGPLQTLLPHQILVCLRFGADATLLRIEALHGTAPPPRVLQALLEPQDGLALRIARHCMQGALLPVLGDFGAKDARGPLRAFRTELAQYGIGRLLVHGTGWIGEGGSAFILFGLPTSPGARHAHYLEMLLPCLHLALTRLPPLAGVGADAPARSLSRRELEIVGWVREGKRNDEIGDLLGISSLTIKNHLQRIYRVLGVTNRTHALARCIEMRLLQ
jgi:transcriptional regulator EpsA